MDKLPFTGTEKCNPNNFQTNFLNSTKISSIKKDFQSKKPNENSIVKSIIISNLKVKYQTFFVPTFNCYELKLFFAKVKTKIRFF